MTTIKTDQIKEMFQKETGVSKTKIEEISEAFPVSLIAHIHTIDRTFTFNLAQTGKAEKGTFKEEK